MKTSTRILYTNPAVILSGDRGDQWTRILGTNALPIFTPCATQCSLNPDDPVYFLLDVEALSEGQRRTLIGYLAHRYGSSYDQVEKDLSFIGVPIRDGADCRISTPAGWSMPVGRVLPDEVFDPRCL